MAEEGDKQKIYPTKQEVKETLREVKREVAKEWRALKG